MARKTKSAPAHAPTPKGLAVSDLRLRLEGLEKDNGKILGQIKKKQTELDNLFAQIETIRQELSQRTAPLMQKMYELDEQIHQAFTAILTGRKLGKKTRQDIEIIYSNMQAAGVISARSDGSSENAESFFDADDQEEDEDSEEWYDYHRARPNLEKEPPKLDRDEQKKIRQIYLRLAEVFHPDKVLGDADQEYYAEVMKEINQAYQNGDLAKLLAIEKQHQMGEEIDRNNEDDLTRRCARLEQENEFLKNQFENLKKQLRLAKNSEPGAIATEHRKLTKSGIDPIGEALEEVEAQVEVITEIHEFVTAFRDRRMTIKEFLRGPKVIQQMQEEMEAELFAEFIADFERYLQTP